VRNGLGNVPRQGAAPAGLDAGGCGGRGTIACAGMIGRVPAPKCLVFRNSCAVFRKARRILSFEGRPSRGRRHM